MTGLPFVWLREILEQRYEPKISRTGMAFVADSGETIVVPWETMSDFDFDILMLYLRQYWADTPIA